MIPTSLPTRTPFDLARQWAARHPEWGTWQSHLAAYFRHGYVWSSPRAFVLAREIQSAWWRDAARLADHAQVAPDGDCWFIWLAAGDMAEFFAVCPRQKPLVCYCRRGEPRLISTTRLARKVTALRASASPSRLFHHSALQ